jgi:hypothetical protein
MNLKSPAHEEQGNEDAGIMAGTGSGGGQMSGFNYLHTTRNP